MNDICMILNEDSKEWPDYIMSLFKNQSQVSVKKEFDTKLSSLSRGATNNTRPLAKVVVIIISHGHLDFLRQNRDYNYKSLLAETPNVILFMLGVKKEELGSHGFDRQPIQNRFPELTRLKFFHHDHTNEMVEYIEKCLKKQPTRPKPPPVESKRFQLVPEVARSEDPTLITLFFDEPIAPTPDKVKVEALLSNDKSESVTLVLPAEWKNPYSFTFTAPDYPEGTADIRIVVNGKLAGSKTLKYVSNIEKYNAISQIYIHQLNKLCGLMKNKIPNTDIDNCLSSIFDQESPADIPAEAFELLFGVFRFASCETSDFELPTLLHFAARHGLQELTSKLTDLPDAALAHSIRNKDKRRPEELARDYKHSSLKTFLENIREVNEGIEDLYVKCTGYINADGPGRAEISGYLMARNHRLLAGLNSTPEYIAVLPSDVGEVADDEDDELYYMYVPTPAQPTDAGDINSNRLSQTPSAAAKPPLRAQPRPPSSASASSASRVPTMSGNQQQLVEIMNTYKENKCSIGEVEKMFKQWKLQVQDTSTAKSFRDKQEKLKRMKEDVVKARQQGGGLSAKADVSPALPPRSK